MTCKWLITMVSFRPLTGVIPFAGLYKWLTNGGDPHLLNGMILEVWLKVTISF